MPAIDHKDLAPDDGMISIIGPDGKPQVVPADTRPWWEELQDFVDSLGEAFDETEGKSFGPIQIKSYEC